MGSLHTGVTYYEDDRGKGPFTVRIGGTNEFVSRIQTGYYGRWGSHGKEVVLVEGWDNPEVLKFKTMEAALSAADAVWDIEGFHTSIEATHNEST
jgi:hypothetical protein